ncbi:hypothetical protein K432DRAFT_292037 [Lepidopterella palustris CBS 459.81]|uniref:Uncharacterized protein n=1 Tax=Lepidopterella palustris CBS 459.81 TaxID=1314670 RepID=A0A8E2EFU1_9PEZI|nr:hypothetical protein K432DRAFT_292037 [Lepidopterella palustris CBS 459.81]
MARVLRRRLAGITPLNCHAQRQSPLFSVLPPELRNQIFELAVSQYDDLSRPYRENAYWYRPGHHYEPRTDTRLLRTCRLVYYETCVIPMRSATHHVYFEHGISVPNYFFHFARKEQENIYHLHIFTNFRQYELRFIQNLLTGLRLHWKRITMTVRTTDWLTWDDGGSARDMEKNLKTLILPDSCKEFVLEFEAPATRKTERDQRISGAATWEFKAQSGAVFTTEASRIAISTWTGSADINGVHWGVHSPGTTIEYHVSKLTWRPSRSIYRAE